MSILWLMQFLRKRVGFGIALVMIPTLFLGCTSTKGPLVLDPIGPAPHAPLADGLKGSLVVYSAFEAAPDLNRSPYRNRYTDYRVLSADGEHLIQVVTNNRETLLNSPPAVELPAGSYRIFARANGYGPIIVPIVIEPTQVTTVHLEGSVWWPRSSQIFASNPVRLPKGEIAGWRADAR